MERGLAPRRGAGHSPIFSVRLGKVSLSRVCHPQPYRRRLWSTPVFYAHDLRISAKEHPPNRAVGGWNRYNAGKATMLGRHVYRVHPTAQGWTVTKEGEDHPRSGFPGREEAIAEAVRLAESDEPAKVTVDNGDGTIAEEWLFGSDPVAELGA